jgi:hypothetical protein
LATPRRNCARSVSVAFRAHMLIHIPHQGSGSRYALSNHSTLRERLRPLLLSSNMQPLAAVAHVELHTTYIESWVLIFLEVKQRLESDRQACAVPYLADGKQDAWDE